MRSTLEKHPREDIRELCPPLHHTASSLNPLAQLHTDALSLQEPSEETWEERLLYLLGGKQSLLLTSKVHSYFHLTQEGTTPCPFGIW